MRVPKALIALCFLSSCATVPEASTVDTTLAYGCEDLIVIGRLTNGDYYQHVQIENDMLGHGWFSAELLVKRSIKGEPTSKTLPVRYFAHTYLRSDRDFLFVLTPHENGYEVTYRRMMPAKTRIAEACK